MMSNALTSPQARAPASSHRNLVAGLMRRVNIDLMTAEDIVQDVLLRHHVAPCLPDDARGTLNAYLATSCYHRALDVLRSNQAREHREHRYGAHPGVTLRLDDHIVDREAAHVLRQAIRRLSPEQQQVIQLAFFDGLSYVAVAAHLRLPVGTVKGRIRAALARLALDVHPALLGAR